MGRVEDQRCWLGIDLYKEQSPMFEGLLGDQSEVELCTDHLTKSEGRLGDQAEDFEHKVGLPKSEDRLDD